MKPQPKAAAKAQKPAAQAKPAKAPPKKAPPKKAPAVKAPAKATAPAKKSAQKPVKAPAAKAAAKPSTPAKKAATPSAKAPAKAAKPAPAPKSAASSTKTSRTINSSPDRQAAKKTVAAPAKAPPPVASASSSTPVAAEAAAPVRAVSPPPALRHPADPPRAIRPSARLAQITVPSMAQSVASNAPKASYLQTPSPPVLKAPPQLPVKKDPKLVNNWKTKSAEELTDAEVLAMPDAEYMNDKQMTFFRLKLVKLKDEILASAGETTEHLREDTVIVPDPADRATIEEEHALELRTRDRERKLLKKIEQSITRIDAGDYGYCDETGEPIGVGRLLARPTATLSLEAQQRRELKQKMFGD